ncbi:type IV secretion system protein [Methylocystis echinoides]|uniref:Conjugal transfer protein n=1 Tax=Methylocystis echinoides TaxID=29468 RepID=A0A9W6GYP6_9HYPH|nr:type IV secretion system protein [Methylocystis echinoides]RTL81139.1 MAG: type VI secretion protein [Hyphomicrobiales bacterium]GLI95211.1 conjugal transfer protein [Methylocystis echinoides]GLI95546.1 conjugal transfer protein [Methylocystis echinoides]
MIRKSLLSLSLGSSLLLSAAALAQVPVIDTATLTQATQTAQNTAQIMNTNQQILETVNNTLAAVTGDRSTGGLSSIGLGGFSVSSAPDLSSLLGGGSLSMGALGSYGTLASSIINGLNLVKTLTGANSAASTTDLAYTGAVNTSAAITAAVSGAQAASVTRSSGFKGAAGQIGSAPDIKGSIDQNSQIQTQTGQTINELIGTVNLTNAALNAQQQQDLAAQSKLANMWSYEASKATLVGQ